MAELEPGTSAPDFTLADSSGNKISLSDYSGRSVVVYFYPKAATPGCTTEACDFRDNLGSLQAAGYDVLGISQDDGAALQSFSSSESLTFPLLSDPGAEVAKAYGAYGDKELNGKTVTGILRSTVVVDPDGTITHAEYRVEPNGHVRRLREALKV